MNEFKAWLNAEINSGRILPKSLIRSAFTYTLNQWKALNRYTEQGYLSYDNNAAERAVKYPAIGRKNCLFVGNVRAGKHAGYFFSLVNSAKLNGVEPFAWLLDLMEKLPEYRQSEVFSQASRGGPLTSNELDEFLPDRWLVTHPDRKWGIDSIRRDERKRNEVLKRPKRKSASCQNQDDAYRTLTFLRTIRTGTNDCEVTEGCGGCNFFRHW